MNVKMNMIKEEDQKRIMDNKHFFKKIKGKEKNIMTKKKKCQRFEMIYIYI